MSQEICVGAAGETITAEQVCLAAQQPGSVTVDAKALSRLRKESPKPGAFKAEEAEASAGSGSTERLSAQQSSAALFCVLLRLVNGASGVRPAVVEAVSHLLNTGTASLPQSDADAAALGALCAFLHGDAAASSTGAEAALGDAAPKVSAAERAQLQAGQPVSCAVLALTAVRLRGVLAASTACLAATTEALRASAKAFDAKAVQAGFPQAAAAAAAEVLCYVEGSALTNVKAKEGGAGEHPELFRGCATIGDAQAALAATVAAVREELNTYATPTPLPASAALARTAAPLATAALAASVRSLARTALLVPRLSAAPVATRGATAPPDAGLGGCASCVEGDLLPELQKRQRGAGERAQQCAAALAAATVSEDAAASPTVAAAACASEAAECLAACCALEALVATIALRQCQGAPNGAAGVAIGKGTRVFTSFIERIAAGDASAEPQADGDGVSRLSEAFVRTLTIDGGAGAALARARDSIAQALCGKEADGTLGELKALIEASTGRRLPKIPKGTRDFLPAEMAIRKLAFATIEAVFERHGAVTIDTPVFERRETLTGKYGEDSKLIYDLADQGGELLSLRYDLTVPFARYVALNGVGQIKRYHIGKVYRRDNPAMNRGRFREFYQCDFDIAGSHASMVADAEVIKVLDEILVDLDIGDFVIKLNHRVLLDAIMAIAGVPPAKFRPICSAIDKLDKAEWPEVRREMTADKGLPEPVADRIGEFVALRGAPVAMLERLRADAALAGHACAAAALEELGTMFGLLEAMGGLGHVSFDLSLARGLDYYTGVIYEAVLKSGKVDEAGNEVHVGSVAAGGRYDGLVGMYSGKDVPAVGVSIGVERVFSIMEGQIRARAADEGKRIRATRTQVLVGSFGKGYQKERMKLCSELWAAGVRAEFGYKPNPNFKTDIIGAAQDAGIPVVVLFGEDEMANGTVNVKDMGAQEQRTVPRGEVADAVKEMLKGKPDGVL